MHVGPQEEEPRNGPELSPWVHARGKDSGNYGKAGSRAVCDTRVSTVAVAAFAFPEAANSEDVKRCCAKARSCACVRSVTEHAALAFSHGPMVASLATAAQFGSCLAALV